MLFNSKSVMMMILTFFQIIKALISIKRSGIELFIEKSIKPDKYNENKDGFMKKINKTYIIYNNRLISKVLNIHCLERSLITFYFANKYGVSVILEMGVRHIQINNKNTLSGHAWIIYNGEPLNETLNVTDFTKIYSISNT